MRAKGEGYIKRTLPTWLLENEEFARSLDCQIDAWKQERPRGLAGLVSFVELVQGYGATFMGSHVVKAVSAEHKLAVALAAANAIANLSSASERRLSRLCQVDPYLSEVIEIEVDLAEHGRSVASAESRTRLERYCRRLAQEALDDRSSIDSRGESSATIHDPGQESSFLRHQASGDTLRKLKELKAGSRNACEELWDEEEQAYVGEPERMAEIIMKAAQERQGRSHATAGAGKSFLDHWGANFSKCRTSLARHEIERIILDGPSNKRPGPDGVPGAVFKRYARVLSYVFEEAWTDLSSGESLGEHGLALARKVWMVAPKPKFGSAPKVANLRDLEMGNEVRKILARMLTAVLDEVCVEQLHPAQQAFMRGRNIVRSTSKFLRAFWDRVREQEPSLDPYMLYLLDCTKGYNLMDHGWLMRCLEAAGTPSLIVNVVLSLLPNMPILLLNGVERGELELPTGLTQGCPASCWLYIIAVDPLIAALAKTPGVDVVSGFVDDWSVGCENYAALESVASLVAEFERASSQRINKDKSAIVPARTLSTPEVARCNRILQCQARISMKERLLGIYIGLHATVEDQYADAMAKFGTALDVYGGHRSSMSTAMRVLVVNVFFYSLFAYQNKLFFMPTPMLKWVESRVLAFITPVPWTKLGLLGHLGKLYGVRCSLVDLRLSNVAALLATYETIPELKAGAAASLLRWPHGRGAPFLVHPAISWQVACSFFRSAAGYSYQDFLADVAPHGAVSLAQDKGLAYRITYAQLLEAERGGWEGYLEGRIDNGGADGRITVQELKSLPRTIPQGHRWFLLKVHLKGLLSSDRLMRAGVTVGEGQCGLCNDGPDSIAHLVQCSCVVQACDKVRTTAKIPPFSSGLAVLRLQSAFDGASLAVVIAFYAAVWKVRGMCRRGFSIRDASELADLILMQISSPWLNFCTPTMGKRERRAGRVREPSPPNSGEVVYGSDGASRSSSAGRLAGWGAAFWDVGSGGIGAPTATRRDYLGDQSNNVAEYAGLEACFERAERAPDAKVLFLVDSKLLAEQVGGRWACRKATLIPFYVRICEMGERMSAQGKVWRIRHVYREFNQTADKLSNEAIDDKNGNGRSKYW
ncbi:MAG TPA: reverse transcriptase-like protein [Planctomycetaceae bacterium]|nr:reverse transcriptase-like protein [Planctomycetaceae bacterium]